MSLSMKFQDVAIASRWAHQMPRDSSGTSIKTRDTSYEPSQHPIAPGGIVRTSPLLLHGQLLPVGLHAVPKRHPQIGLLLRGHVLPSLLDVGERRVGDGVCLAGLLELAGYRGSSGESCACHGRRDDGSRAPGSPDDGGAQHCGGWSGECRKLRKKGRSFPSGDLQLLMGRCGDAVESKAELSCEIEHANVVSVDVGHSALAVSSFSFAGAKPIQPYSAFTSSFSTTRYMLDR
jgi:hypothetical protein